jgi:hypothetical protein
MFLRKHRDSQFKKSHSVDLFYVTAYLENRLVLNATIRATSLGWRLYYPEQALVIDRIEFPAGLDIDGLFLTTEY